LLFITEILSAFLIGEGKLESYLYENPPLETSHHRAKIGLSEAKKHLLRAAGGENGEKTAECHKVAFSEILLNDIERIIYLAVWSISRRLPAAGKAELCLW
jgi:hypothetical protein